MKTSVNKNKGIALIYALIFSLIVILLGTVSAYITQMGYFSISAEAKYQIAEKKADSGLMKAIDYMVNNNISCENLSSQSYGSGIEVRSKLIKGDWGGSCFIWSKGEYKGAKVIKIGVINISNPDYGAVIVKNLTEIKIKGSGAIASCEANCPTPALVTGNTYSGNVNGTIVDACPNNPKGIIALVDPIKQNANFDTYKLAFNNINNREELLNTLKNSFKVSFDNGAPAGVMGNKVWSPSSNQITGVCQTLLGNVITCLTQIGNATFIFDSSGNFISLLDGQKYDALDLGNATLNIISNFEVPAKIAVGNINIQGNISYTTLVGRNKISIPTNNINISDAKLFSTNWVITGNNVSIEGGIIYGGGGGNTTFDIRSRTQIGSPEKPILIILDNIDVSIGRNGNADIYGLIYSTESNNEFTIQGNGNLEIHGVLMSNSLNTKIDITGNFEIVFAPGIIKKLSENYSFVHPPICVNYSTKASLISTLMKIY